ncbi:MAG TPA: TonB-dependent receptor [Longimicrobiales bacterium]
MTNRPRFVLLTALLFALLSAAPRLFAQDADLLTGRVTDEAGQPLAGARVEAMSIETEITRSVITDRAGRFMINFPDGGGRYLLRITFLGKADVVRTLVREGDEELLVANVSMSDQAIALEAVTAVVRRPQPSRGQTAEQSTELPQELLNRLPLPDLDPNTLAQLAAGVLSTELDSITGRSGFSVAGMSELLNQIVLDGMILGESALQIPEEGVRRTTVTTSTFDAARGGFAGGQLSMTTTRGNNRTAGALTYRLDNDAFQLGSAATVNAYSRQHVSGSLGGPIRRDRLFYNVSFGLQRNVNHRFALSAEDEVSALRAGVARDSVGRFVSALGSFGIPVNGNGQYDQLRDNLSLQLRTDWNMVQRDDRQHTLSLRMNGSRSSEDSTRISTLDLTQHGGETEGDNWAAALSLNSRLRTNWTNALTLSFNESWNESLPFLELPEGRVLVTSDFDDASRATQTLVFGGNRAMPTDAYRKGLQLSNDISFLLPVGTQLHRLKFGGTLQRTRSVSRSADNFLGSFFFNSIEDLENNSPTRFERTLTDRTTRFGSTLFGLYVGDTWRVTEALELTGGLRWDRTRVYEAPAYNPAIEAAFGRRTDIEPVATTLSPRLGFNYRLASAQGSRGARALSGGIGLFAGQAPTNIFVNASRQTGLSDAEQRLLCIGDATPLPDWNLYLSNPDAIPVECADGSSGNLLSLRAPTVSLINPEQRMPASLRAELGYRTRLPFNLNANVRYSYARGMGLWGYYDINLDESERITLANEGRPFFGHAGAIVPGTGQTTLAASRVHSEFGNVFDIRADRTSSTHQLISQISGQLPKGFTVATNYTLSFARDQGSGSGNFNSVPTAASPNTIEWAPANNDRRHTINLTLAKAITPEIEVTAIARLSSGLPFTPMVARDINGDGLNNDRAFIFDPAMQGDTALANGLTRLLAVVPDRIAECVRDQMGAIAERNSCRNGWARSLDMRASIRPNLPRLERRLTFSLDANNILNGLDQLFNGDELKGWGESPRVDTRLLEVRGFDPNTNAFAYEVNEGFGQNRRGSSAIRSPFALRLTARLAIGGQSFQNNRGFGTPMDMRGMTGAFGAGERGAIRDEGRAPGGRAGGNLVALIDRLLANPIPVLLELKDTLRLTSDQVARVQAISDSLQVRLGKQREELSRRLENASPEDQRAAFGEMQSQIEATRRSVIEALAEVQKSLTAEQWQRVPERIRNPFQRGERTRRN